MDTDSYYGFGGDLDNFGSYLSPSLTPEAPIKTLFPQPIKTENRTLPQTLLPTHQQLTGPSHEYGLYKQQTGLVPGALDETNALNESAAYLQPFDLFGPPLFDMGSFDDFDFDKAAAASLADPLIDFGSGSSDLGMSTVDPNAIGGQEPTGSPSPQPPWAQTNTVGRLRPGMHQQAAQQRREYLEQQQRQLAQAQMQQPQQAQPSQQPQLPIDLVRQQKISQVLNAMRSQPTSSEDPGSEAPTQNGTRHKKSAEEMDEDEKLLASDEGKKLDSKTRRQLRNKVSARLFRERRKGEMEDLKYRVHKAEGSNARLNAHINALEAENKRISNLVSLLLSSKEFGPMLNELSSNPARARAIADSNAREIDKPAIVQQQQQQLQLQLSPSQLPQPLDVPPEEQHNPPLSDSVNPYALQLQPSPQGLQFGPF